MDYNLAALKLLCVQLKTATHTPDHNAFSLGAILFQRVWIQGVLVYVPSSDGDHTDRFLLDDGTGVIQLQLGGQFFTRHWEQGMYVMVVGACAIRDGDFPLIKVHKIIDLSPCPDREPMWYLEVIEAFNLFYKPLLEE